MSRIDDALAHVPIRQREDIEERAHFLARAMLKSSHVFSFIVLVVFAVLVWVVYVFAVKTPWLVGALLGVFFVSIGVQLRNLWLYRRMFRTAIQVCLVNTGIRVLVCLSCGTDVRNAGDRELCECGARLRESAATRTGD